jgi:hypothetical protein
MKSILAKELVDAYLSTSFVVFNPAINIKIGEINSELNRLLNEDGVTEWVFITSVNPYSESLSDLKNLELYNELKEAVKEYKFYEGHGIGDDPQWQPEISLLVVGITREEAIRLGNVYRQNAIVFGKIDNPAELVLLR